MSGNRSAELLCLSLFLKLGSGIEIRVPSPGMETVGVANGTEPQNKGHPCGAVTLNEYAYAHDSSRVISVNLHRLSPTPSKSTRVPATNGRASQHKNQCSGSSSVQGKYREDSIHSQPENFTQKLTTK
ncbi:hypothetical protein BCR34DRAFT_596575 [Clohesyomyces aquaticus]|uniref:Uncharacterized protein n=1 Tax=Clohesyomyces aquaticus TaxID=1231657 RepID=A0A1Y2A665_9PLEO|nr:hypothetical protein BCR34DRAFT_596575 [Clohesyomyces aquaticus]